MKNIILFIIASALCLKASAVEILYPSPANEIIIYTNTPVVSNITASVTFTNTITTAYSTYHTFQLFSTALGTNTITGSLDRSIDSVNWVNVVNAAAVTNGTPFETNTTGKAWAYRWRVTVWSSNATVTELYMGQ